MNSYTINNIEEYKRRLDENDINSFINARSSYRDFLKRLKINSFRHIRNLDIAFDSPVTVVSGENRIGKTSLLLLIACSYENFRHIDSTKPDTLFRPFSWRDVICFTKDETDKGGYSYELFWRVGSSGELHGVGKRNLGKQSWTGLGKRSTSNRVNAKIKNREVRFLDLDRVNPARGCSRRLNYKASHAAKEPLSQEVIDFYKYIFEIPDDITIYQTGSHINKRVFLIENTRASVSEAYSSYNDASGEEALLNMLLEMTSAGENALILIDELECGIHPETQRRLADIIQYLSWTKKQQYIITTHSATLLSAFPLKSRKLIEYNNGSYNVISRPAVETVFSKLDSSSHPLVKVYCEDDVAAFCIEKVLTEINKTHSCFSKNFNVVKSGAANDVKHDYERHKRLYNQLMPKQGYCCVFDGDMRNNGDYSSYVDNPNEFVEFLYSDEPPEVFLCRAYLAKNPSSRLESFLSYQDHHAVFAEMVNRGLAADNNDARSLCWQAFAQSAGYNSMFEVFKNFFYRVMIYFSQSASD